MTNTIPVSKLVNVNPKIPSGLREDDAQIVSFVSMDSVSEEGVIIKQEQRILREVIKGYTYFERGDILVAKITPCMENGKAAMATNLIHSIGFGSTEFHVLRPNDGVDVRYVFYLLWSPRFRFYAEKSMRGAVGQKRVPPEFFDRYHVPDVSPNEQKRIADILYNIHQARLDYITLSDKARDLLQVLGERAYALSL